MKLIDFLKLCNPFTNCFILNKTTKLYIYDEIESVYFLLTNFDLSHFVVKGFTIDTYDVNDDDDCIVNAPYLSICVEEVK